MKLWEIDSGRLLLTIFQGTDKEWVAWTPEGYYTASLNGDKYVGWHINRGMERSALYYPASRFSRQFYSPQIVAKYLETAGDIKEAIRLANLERPRRQQIKETSRKDLKNLLPPVVYFKTPSERNTTVTGNQVRIRAVAKSNNREPIQDIWLLVNGRRLSNMRGIAVQAVNDGKTINGLQAEIDVVVPLTQTNNRISVVASNRHSQSEPEVINVNLKAKPNNLYKPDLYLLAIGVSQYKAADYNLDFAHKDAAGLSAALSEQEGRLYANVHRKLLTDRQATKDNILDGLDWMLKESTQKDVSVIFVAGHGLNDERGNYYFLPHDGHPAKLRRSAVKWLEFEDVLTSLPSKVLLLVDTCHSGKVTGKRRGADDMTDALRDLITADSGVVVMTSSTGKESSQEHPDWGHGAFTKALLEGLNGQADYDQDRAIAIKELDLYVTKRVKKLTNGQQHPTTEIPKTMPDFPFVTR